MITPQRRRICLAVAGTLLAVYVAATAVLIGVGALMTHVLAHGALGRWDDDVISWSVRHRTPGWTRADADITHLANTPGIVIAALVATGAVLAVRRTRWAALPALGLVVELAGFLSANVAVGRPRPHVPHLGSTPSTSSWPSGHVAATVVLYGGVALLVTLATRSVGVRVAAWVAATLLVVAVGAARVYAGEHHPTDALAGLALGIAALSGAAYALRSRASA